MDSSDDVCRNPRVSSCCCSPEIASREWRLECVNFRPEVARERCVARRRNSGVLNVLEQAMCLPNFRSLAPRELGAAYINRRFQSLCKSIGIYFRNGAVVEPEVVETSGWYRRIENREIFPMRRLSRLCGKNFGAQGVKTRRQSPLLTAILGLNDFCWQKVGESTSNNFIH